MKIKVLLHPNLPNGFTATVLGWPGLVIKGKTRDETLMRAREEIKNQLTQSELISLEIEPKAADPWQKFAGMWKDDPLFDDFLKEIDAYRKAIESSEG